MRWVDIPGWEARYQISEYGDVRSKDMRVGAKGGAKATRKGRVLIKVLKNNGYYSVTLTDGINRPQIGLHRLVARAFIGECPLGLHVLHFDGNKANNHFANLRYGTPAENIADTKRMGRIRRGENNPGAKLTEYAVRDIRSSAAPTQELAKKYAVTCTHIHAVRKGRVWAHVK